MADSHSTPAIPTTGTERSVIVRYRPNGGDKSIPSITLSGAWLRDAGFDTGQHLTVKAMNGCIVLVKYSEREEFLLAEAKKSSCELKEIKSMIKTACKDS
ncbi:SymE family type I addiction module toxin [Kosakonia cowanii]|uniref:SymE family type I addiction module toxin n=1 Tax=Kosakonia cowanii TaxID=208223 RepID=UPI003207F205